MSLNINLTKYLNILEPGDKVVVAVSGGVDSSVLLDLIIKSEFTPIIAHVNHNKRIESIEEENYLRTFAKNNNLDIEVLDYHYEENNFQAEAHDKRYEFFYQTAIKYNAKLILTAHHGYDNLETILMNLIRGSNLYGYSGISEFVPYKNLFICRPLLQYKKTELYQYAKNHDIKYFEDNSNQEDCYLRNRIRHHVIPLLEQENSNLLASINNYSNQLFNAFNYIRSLTINYLNNELTFNVQTFNKLHIAIKKDVINYLFEQYDILSSDNKINDILDLISSNKPNLSYDLGNNYQFIKAYDDCYISIPKESLKVHKELDKYDTLIIDNYGSFYFRRHLHEHCDDYLPLDPDEKYPLTVRTRMHGDKLIIGEGHKKLKDFLIDKKVSKEERDNLLIVTNSENEIIWVLGYYKKKVNSENALNLIFERMAKTDA